MNGRAVENLEVLYATRNTAFVIAVIEVPLGECVLVALLIERPPLLLTGPGRPVSFGNVFR
jgi:hypothetical protein